MIETYADGRLRVVKYPDRELERSINAFIEAVAALALSEHMPPEKAMQLRRHANNLLIEAILQ